MNFSPDGLTLTSTILNRLLTFQNSCSCTNLKSPSTKLLGSFNYLSYSNILLKYIFIFSGSKPGSRPSAQPKTSGMNTAVVAGAAAVGVLVIVGVIIFAIWWKRRKSSSDGKLH